VEFDGAALLPVVSPGTARIAALDKKAIAVIVRALITTLHLDVSIGILRQIVHD
jgi:hypothetical protein